MKAAGTFACLARWQICWLLIGLSALLCVPSLLQAQSPGQIWIEGHYEERSVWVEGYYGEVGYWDSYTVEHWEWVPDDGGGDGEDDGNGNGGGGGYWEFLYSEDVWYWRFLWWEWDSGYWDTETVWVPGQWVDDEPLDPPVMDEAGPVFSDVVHNHEIIPSKTIEPDPKVVESGKAKITLSVEMKAVTSGDTVDTEPPRIMAANVGGLFQYKGAGEIRSESIELEPVPGRQNWYRAKAKEFNLGSKVWYNVQQYVDGMPKLATMHAEYQHYSEYAKRLEELAETLAEILDRDCFGTPQQIQNDIKREIQRELREFQITASAESVRYDSHDTSPTDPDVGTHRGELGLGRKVRVPENFTTFPSNFPSGP